VLTEKGHWVDAPFFSFGQQPLMRSRLTESPIEDRIRDCRASLVPALSTGNVVCGRRQSCDRRSALWSFPQGGMKRSRLSAFGIARGIVYGDGTRFAKGSAVDLHGNKDAELLKWFL